MFSEDLLPISMAFFLVIGVTSLELCFHGVDQLVVVQEDHVGM